MPYKRVTMQAIADACGLSRNTVSKVFNDRGDVPEATKALVLQKAREMGYLQGELLPKPAQSPQAKNIALLSCSLPTEFHFCNFFIPAFAESMSEYGYTLVVYKITPEELQKRLLPARLRLPEIAGLLAIEVFDREYMDMLCDLNLPTLFIDAYAGAFQSILRCNMLSMENIAGVVAVTEHIIDQGAKKLGFVGDITHCNSFYERWIGFNVALQQRGLSVNPELCITLPDIHPYEDADWMYGQIAKMKALPEAFVCGNDLLAIRLMTAIKRLGLSIPGDIMLAGFDGQPQSAVVEPALTTVQIPSEEIGRMAARILYNHIQNPGLPLISTYVKTTPIFRASTAKA